MQFFPFSYLQTKYIYHLAAWGDKGCILHPWNISALINKFFFFFFSLSTLSFPESIQLFIAQATFWPQMYSRGKKRHIPGPAELGKERRGSHFRAWEGDDHTCSGLEGGADDSPPLPSLLSLRNQRLAPARQTDITPTSSN